VSSELRRSPLAKTSTMKATIAIPQTLKLDLDRYAELHSQRRGEPTDVAVLIPHMLATFIAREPRFQQRHA
jgi:hypothetical protein